MLSVSSAGTPQRWKERYRYSKNTGRIFKEVNLTFIIPALEEGIVIALFLAEEWASSHLEMVLSLSVTPSSP